MDPAEVLGVEISQFAGESLKTMAPRVIGQTAEAQQKKSAGAQPSKQWDEPSFFEALKTRCTDEEVNAARKLLDWMTDLLT